LELEVAMIILATGIAGLGALVTSSTRQVVQIDQWCADSPTYYLQSQEDPWLRQLGTPADMNDTAGQAVWTPPVAGESSQQYRLLSYETDTDTQTTTVRVELNSGGGSCPLPADLPTDLRWSNCWS